MVILFILIENTQEKMENLFPYWTKKYLQPEVGKSDPECFDFDFDASSTPVFPGFPQPLSISSSGPNTAHGKHSALPTSPPPTPPSKLAKTKSASDMNDANDSSHPYAVAVFTCSEFSDWIESHLALNETKYPVISGKNSSVPIGGSIISPRYDEEWVTAPASPPKAHLLRAVDLESRPDDDGVALPVCSYVCVADIVGWKPQVVSRRQSILIYIVTPEKSRGQKIDCVGPAGYTSAGGLFGLSSLSIDVNKPSVKRSTSDSSEPMSLSPRNGDEVFDADVSFEEGDDKNGRKASKKESESSENFSIIRDLPPLFVQSCSGTNLYLLGAYSSVTVTGCVECEIVIGAVHGVIRLVGCEKVRLTVACRKLIIVSCSECAINVACLRPTVLIGENKALAIGSILCISLYVTFDKTYLYDFRPTQCQLSIVEGTFDVCWFGGANSSCQACGKFCC